MKNTKYILSTLLLAAVMHAVPMRAVAQESYSSMEFVENRGQWDPSVQYRGAMEAGAFFLQPQGFTVLRTGSIRRVRGM